MLSWIRRSFRGGTGQALMMACLACNILICVAPRQAMSQTPPASETPEAGAPPGENPFPGKFPAPSLDGGVEWFNTSAEIDLRELRGKVVLLDFWTYCCINCMHILPDLKYLEQKYADQLVVIGVHAAKFDNEKDSENIRRAVLRYGIEHPVVNDANMVIAEKYFFRAWPQLVLIDPEGKFVGLQTGEGIRDLFDSVIGQMVAYHRAKGTLDEHAVHFDLERTRQPAGNLKFPGKVLADEAGGRLFVADSSHNRIVVSSLDGDLIDVIGSGATGRQDGLYEQAEFDHPQGMALVGNVLYVADTENHLLRTVDLDARTVGTLAGTGAQARDRLPGGPLRSIALNSPWDVLHLNGTLYVAMAGSHQLWRHRLGSGTIEAFAGSGREDVLDGPLSSSALAQPSAIATDGKDLYFVDSEGSAVRRLPTREQGEVTTLVGAHDLERGRALFEFGDRDGVGDAVRLQHPIGLTYAEGMLYVADSYNHKIKRVDPAQRESTTWLGTGAAGGGLSPVQLFEPAGVDAAAGTLYIADTNNHRVLATDLRTRETTEFVIWGLTPPATPAPPRRDTNGPPPVEVAAQQVKSADALRFRITFDLPEGFKLNKAGPVSYTLSAVGDQPLVAKELLDGANPAETGESDAVVSVPLSSETGAGTFDLTISYTYCREGTGGVCRFARQKWRIPVAVAAGAEAKAVELTATP